MHLKRSWTWLLIAGALSWPRLSWAGDPDSDGDGVPDSIDVCCDTQPGVAVDAEGRPLGDLDGDCDVDIHDFARLQLDMRGPEVHGCCLDEDCDDGDACTNDSCDRTKGCTHGPVNCDDGDACTDDSCDSSIGCVHETHCAVCVPDAIRSCYSGPPGTQDVATCRAGQQVCNQDGLAWGPCDGEVLPTPEICANGIDEDCNGAIDDAPDEDGDGWTRCDGDCCDSPRDGCGEHPELVNPGALEILGNGIDDDCDPSTSDITAPSACSAAAKFTAVTAIDAAQAMDLCQTTTANPPLALKKWGLISAAQLNPNGTSPNAQALLDMQNYQTAVLANYGTGGILPTKNISMAGIATGRMRDQNDPGWVAPVAGTDFGSARVISFSVFTGPLGAYLAAHGGSLLPGNCGAVPCATGTGAYDGVLLRLVIRVPTNVESFSYDFRFFSAEYQTYQCTAYNDYFLPLLTSGAAGIPADKNISFDALGKPVNVNSGFLQICPGNGKNCQPCSYGTGPLAGTGMQVSNVGGGTPWLTTNAPVVPGETITLEFMLFDVNDHIYDSLILLDNFRWNVSPASVSTQVASP